MRISDWSSDVCSSDLLRQLFHVRGRPVDVYARQPTLASLAQRFAYAFEGKDGYPPSVKGHLLPDELALGPFRVRVVDQPHGPITSAGIRFDCRSRSACYSTDFNRSEEHTSELQSLMRISYAVFCLKKQNTH